MAETKIITKKEKGLNRHWKNFLDKDYLGSHNLEEGEEMLLTIAKYEGEELVFNSLTKMEEPKQVLYFEEDVPKMILNITNANTLATLYGTHPENWIGKQIQVYKINGNWRNPVTKEKVTEALRIRDFIPRFDVDVEKYKSELDKATDLNELKSIWVKLPASVRNNKDVAQHKDELKAKLSGK